MECSFEPFEFPADGKLFELIASDDAARTVGFQSAWITKETYRQHPDSIPTTRGLINRCRFTNYGTAPIFNIKVSADVEFKENIPKGPNIFEQKTVERKKYNFLIPEVSANSGHTDFYALNVTKYIVMFQFPDEIELQKLGVAVRETAKLIPAQRLVVIPPLGTFADILPSPKAPTSPPDADQTNRRFTTETVRQLLALYEGRTPLQADKLIEPFKGLWIEGASRVLNVIPDGPGRAIVVLRDDKDTIECRFGPKWSDETARLSIGDPLRVRGQISSMQNGSQLYLLNCEIVASL